MAKFRKDDAKEVPAISTGSMPDIIFMLIFFFMVTTSMRETSLKVKMKLPEATEVQKLEKKQSEDIDDCQAASNSKNSSNSSSSINFISSLTKSGSTNMKTSYNSLQNSNDTLKEENAKENTEDIGKINSKVSEETFLNRKRMMRSTKTSSSSNKKEITIDLITLPQTEHSRQLIESNYSYLTERFGDEIDEFSKLNSEIKSLLSEEKIKEYFREDDYNESVQKDEASRLH